MRSSAKLLTSSPLSEPCSSNVKVPALSLNSDAACCARNLDDDFAASWLSNGHEGCTVTAPVICVSLGDGSIHRCGGDSPCDHAFPNEDRMLTCEITGIVFEKECCDEIFDLNGGNEKKSGNPDLVSGEQCASRSFRRADASSLSRCAFMCASATTTSDENQLAQPRKGRPVPAARRGATLVGSVPRQFSDCKRRRGASMRGQHASPSVMNGLNRDAAHVLGTLLRRRDRVCDTETFETVLQRHVRDCSVRGIALTMDDAHNIELQLRASQRVATVSAERQFQVVSTAKYRATLTGLIIYFWTVVCKTPHIINAHKKGVNASFRPFACGVLYAMKRGITLPDGQQLLPQCSFLDAVLPDLRDVQASSELQSLHSNSHRGLCIITRSVNSVPRQEQASFFAGVIRNSTTFAEANFKCNDV